MKIKKLAIIILSVIILSLLWIVYSIFQFKEPETNLNDINEKYHLVLEKYEKKNIVSDNKTYRNKDNNRWYGLIMNVEDNKLGKDVKGRWVINIKPPKHMFNELLKLDNIFLGWHMNKKIMAINIIKRLFS